MDLIISRRNSLIGHL